MRLKSIFCICLSLLTMFFSQVADKREPRDRLPLAPETHRAGRQVGAPQEDRPQIRAAQRRFSFGHAPLSGDENELCSFTEWSAWWM